MRKPDHPEKALDHLARQRNVEGTIRAPLGTWDVQRPAAKVEMLRLRLHQSRGPASREQGE